MIDEKTAPSIVVDRGQPVIVVVSFCDDDPDLGVYFSFTKPGEERPYTDDGYGQPRSKITRLGRGIYRYVIQTSGFEGGDGVWHCHGEWSEARPDGYDAASIFGEYHVNHAPAQLL
jgi:hypothetical protein